jgi:hypothetical protein
MYSRFSAVVRFSEPPLELDFERLSANHALQRRNLGFVFLE